MICCFSYVHIIAELHVLLLDSMLRKTYVASLPGPCLQVISCLELHGQAGSALQDASHCSCGFQFCQSGAGLLPHVCVGVGRCWGSVGHLCLTICQLWRHVLPHVEEGNTTTAGHGHSTRPSSSSAHSAGQHLVKALQALWLRDLYTYSASAMFCAWKIFDLARSGQGEHLMHDQFAYWLTKLKKRQDCLS